MKASMKLGDKDIARYRVKLEELKSQLKELSQQNNSMRNSVTQEVPNPTAEELMME